MKKLRTLVVVHASLVPPENLEGHTEKEIEQWRTEYDVTSTLRTSGHEVRVMGVLDSLTDLSSAIADWKITLPDTVADNASSGAVVLGSRPVRPDALDLSLTGCLLHRNGRLEGTGAGGAVLGSPVNALVWLANTLGQRGVTLEAGHVILPGSVCAAIPFGPGDTVSAVFDRLGSVSITFSEK